MVPGQYSRQYEMNSLSMKIRTALAMTLLVVMVAACAKPDLDFSQFPLPSNPTPILEKYEHKLDMVLEDFTVYKSKDERLMWYGGKSLSGSMIDNEHKKNGFFAANHASFYVEKASQKVTAYELHTETRDKTDLLEAALQARLGKPDYFYRDQSFSYRVWERDGDFHFLSTNSTVVLDGEKTRTADLMVISSTSPALLNWFGSGGGFSRYGDYLYERAKPERSGQKYQYTDFFREQEAEAKSWGQEHSRYFENYVEG